MKWRVKNASGMKMPDAILMFMQLAARGEVMRKDRVIQAGIAVAT